MMLYRNAGRIRQRRSVCARVNAMVRPVEATAGSELSVLAAFRSFPRPAGQAVISIDPKKKEPIASTTSRTGLTVRCALDTRGNPKGNEVSRAEAMTCGIEGETFHPEWNYTISSRRWPEAADFGCRLMPMRPSLAMTQRCRPAPACQIILARFPIPMLMGWHPVSRTISRPEGRPDITASGPWYFRAVMVLPWFGRYRVMAQNVAPVVSVIVGRRPSAFPDAARSVPLYRSATATRRWSARKSWARRRSLPAT